MDTVELRSLEIKISRSENLPVLPQVATSVLKMADDVDASPRAMAALIERDAAIAAKVLRVANSSYYGMKDVTSIGRALSLMGMNAIRTLVTGIAYQQVIGGRQHSKSFSKVDFWRHSVATATTAKILGKIKGSAQADDWYALGLMHDLGLLAMDRFAPEELDQAIAEATRTGAPLHEVERALLGFDHAEVGGFLAERWQLSVDLTSAIRYHFSPLDDPENPTQTTLISIADRIAQQCGFACVNGLRYESIPAEWLEAVEIPDAQVEPIKEVVRQEIERAEAILMIK